jgi:hypothetical protein
MNSRIAMTSDVTEEYALGFAPVFVALGTVYPFAQRRESLRVLQP